MVEPSPGILAALPQRLRLARLQRDLTLDQAAGGAGLSAAHLSRLESGERHPSLPALLALADVYGLSAGELLAPPHVDRDDVVHRAGDLVRRPRGDVTAWPLSRAQQGRPLQAFKTRLARSRTHGELVSHAGQEWLYVLSGRLVLRLGGDTLHLTPGEAADFDTRTPHWLGTDGTADVELLLIVGAQGARIHTAQAPPGGG